MIASYCVCVISWYSVVGWKVVKVMFAVCVAYCSGIISYVVCVNTNAMFRLSNMIKNTSIAST